MREYLPRLALALALALPLAACGGDSTGPGDTPGKTHLSFKSSGYYSHSFNAQKDAPASLAAAPNVPTEYAFAMQQNGMTAIIGAAPVGGGDWGVAILLVAGTTAGDYSLDGYTEGVFFYTVVDPNSDTDDFEDDLDVETGTVTLTSVDSKRVRARFSAKGTVYRFDYDSYDERALGAVTISNGSIDVAIRNDLINDVDFARSPVDARVLRTIERKLPGLMLQLR